jgi:hypothetical protein
MTSSNAKSLDLTQRSPRSALSLPFLLLLRAREALMFLPAFGMFPGVSASVVSHKPDLRPLLEAREKQTARDEPTPPRQTAKGKGRTC